MVYKTPKHVAGYQRCICVISGFSRDADKICALLQYYAAFSGCSVPTFQDNLSVPSSRVNKSKIKGFLLWLFDRWRWDRQVFPKRRYRPTTQRWVIPQKSADLKGTYICWFHKWNIKHCIWFEMPLSEVTVNINKNWAEREAVQHANLRAFCVC